MIGTQLVCRDQQNYDEAKNRKEETIYQLSTGQTCWLYRAMAYLKHKKQDEDDSNQIRYTVLWKTVISKGLCKQKQGVSMFTDIIPDPE